MTTLMTVNKFFKIVRLPTYVPTRHLLVKHTTLKGTVEKNLELESIHVATPKPRVFHVSLNRPRHKNALNATLWRELRVVFEHLNSNSECRVIVLSGTGSTFCSGLDLKEMLPEVLRVSQSKTLDVGRKAINLRNLVAGFQESISSIEECEKPVIAAICGHCLGAGISIATATDIRYASNDSVFSIKEVDLGITADVGILNRINKIVGNDGVTRELAFTGRNFDSSEAFDYGLISRKFSPQECVNEAIVLAAQIAEKSPIAIRGVKVLLNYAREHTVSESLEYARMWNQCHLQSEDLLRASEAILTKTKPEFNDA